MTFPVVAGGLTLVDLLLMLAPVAVVPMGLRLAPLQGKVSNRLLGLARLVQPVGAVAALASFMFPPGWLSGWLAAGWLAACAVASLAGLAEVIEERSVGPAHLLPAVALGFLSVGAAWLVAYRGGIDLGYAPVIEELTAVHFHYAGFAATMMAALTLARVTTTRPRWRVITVAAGWLVMLGVPVTAAGVATGSGLLTVIGPIGLAVGVLTMSGITGFIVVPGLPGPASRWLLGLSAGGVVIPMLLGVDYAMGRVLPVPSLDLRTMALVHGDLNALVFALLGFAGWLLVKRAEQ
ncbi:MAG TPA: YndJ family transporter [Candidatus Dormibacteraeota bacterium]